MNRNLTNWITMILAAVGVLLAGWLTVEHFLPSASLPCGSGPGGCETVLESAYSHVGPIPLAAFGVVMYLAIAALCAARRPLLRSFEGDAGSMAASGTGLVEPRPEFEVAPSVPGSNLSLDAKSTTESGSEPSKAAGAKRDIQASGAEAGELNHAVAISPVEAGDGAIQDATLAYPGGIAGSGDYGIAGMRLRKLDILVWLLAASAFLISWVLQYLVLFVLQSFCPYCMGSAILVTVIFMIASADFWLKGDAPTELQKISAAWLLLLLGIFVYTGISREQQNRSLEHADTAVYQEPPNQADVSEVKDANRNQFMPPGSHVLGSANAQYDLVEFGDYQCPSCKRGSAAAADVVTDSNNKVNLVFRNQPLPMAHHWAIEEALAAEAAALQGRFWPMHDALYAHQDEVERPDFSPDRIAVWAKELGLDMARFNADWHSTKVRTRVDKDRLDAEAVGVKVTPTFFFLSPHHIWRFSAAVSMLAALKDPNSMIWKN